MKSYPPRVPRHHKPSEGLGFLLVILTVATIVLGAVVLVPGAVAAPIPGDGPQLSGRAAPDKTLIGLWYYGPDGTAMFLREGDVLRVEELHVIVYAPNADLEEGKIELYLVWEREVETTTQTVNADGALETQTVRVWNETSRQSVLVEASSYGLEDTAIDLPPKHGERLRIVYEDGERFSFDIVTVTHDTSVIYAKLPRQQLQESWLVQGQVLLVALVTAVISVWASKKIHTRAGGHVPDIGTAAWVVLPLLTIATLVGLWYTNREGLVLQGAAPLFVLLGILVCVMTLQIWREPGPRWLLLRFHPNAEAPQPGVQVWTVTVPSPTRRDTHAATTRPNHAMMVDATWRDFLYRALGARTYLELPENRQWYYNVENAAMFSRLYLVSDEYVVTERVGFYLERVEGWIPVRLRFRDLVYVPLPVSPWATDETVVQVIQDILTLGEVAEHYGELKVTNARLMAALEAESVNKGRELLEEYLRAEYATRLNKPLREISPEFYDRIRRLQPRVKTAAAEPAAPTTVQVQQKPDPAAAAAAAAATPAPAPAQVQP